MPLDASPDATGAVFLWDFSASFEDAMETIRCLLGEKDAT